MNSLSRVAVGSNLNANGYDRLRLDLSSYGCAGAGNHRYLHDCQLPVASFSGRQEESNTHGTVSQWRRQDGASAPAVKPAPRLCPQPCPGGVLQ